MRHLHAIIGALVVLAFSASAQMQIEHDVTNAPAVSPMLSDRFTWTDSSVSP